MRYILKINIALGMIVLLSSCKKDVPSNGSLAGGTNVVYTPPSYNNIYGVIQAEREYATTNTYFYSFGIFYSAPKNVLYDSFNTMKIGYLKFNNVAMLPDSNGIGGPYDYKDTTSTIYPTNGSWDVGGAGPIPSFILPTKPFPSFTGFAGLPDTIHKSQNLTINLPGISGADFMKIYLSPGNPNYISPVYLASPSCTILSSNLLGFNIGSQPDLIIDFYKRDINSVSGKNIVSTLVSEYSKPVYIAN